MKGGVAHRVEIIRMHGVLKTLDQKLEISNYLALYTGFRRSQASNVFFSVSVKNTENGRKTVTGKRLARRAVSCYYFRELNISN